MAKEVLLFLDRRSQRRLMVRLETETRAVTTIAFGSRLRRAHTSVV